MSAIQDVLSTLQILAAILFAARIAVLLIVAGYRL
jgi:hypothetical protein